MKWKIVLVLALISPLCGLAQSSTPLVNPEAIGWTIDTGSGINGLVVEQTTLKEGMTLFKEGLKSKSYLGRRCSNNRKVYGVRYISVSDTSLGILMDYTKYRRIRKLMTWSTPTLSMISISKGQLDNGLIIGKSTKEDILRLYPDAECRTHRTQDFMHVGNTQFALTPEGVIQFVGICTRCTFGPRVKATQE